MYDYKSILFKSPTPFVIIEIQDNHAIIKESNAAYKLYVTERYNIVVEDILTDCIVNFNYRKIKIDKTIYNVQIEKIGDKSFIAWFCEKEYLSNDMQENLLLSVRKFDDVIFLVSDSKIIFVNKSYENMFDETCDVPCTVEEGFYKFIEKEDDTEEIYYDYLKVIDERVKIKTKKGTKWVWIRSNPIKNE